MRWTVLAVVLTILTAAAQLKTLGGLPLVVAKRGPFDGLIDTSPLARSEIALRADRRTKTIKIIPAGWVLTVTPQASASTYFNDACVIVVENGIPKTTLITVVVTGSPGKTVTGTCARPR